MNYLLLFPVSSNETNAILTSAATGAGVLGLLLIVCLAIVCRRKKPLSRAVVLPPPRPRLDLGDHAVLVRQTDRLGLIAFAEGLQNCQVILLSQIQYQTFIVITPKQTICNILNCLNSLTRVLDYFELFCLFLSVFTNIFCTFLEIRLLVISSVKVLMSNLV